MSSKADKQSKLRFCPPTTLNILAPRHRSSKLQGTIRHLVAFGPWTPLDAVLLCLSRFERAAETVAFVTRQVTPEGGGASKLHRGNGALSPWQADSRPRGNALGVLALAVCLLTVFFVVVSTSHIHAAGQSDAPCQICQVAHCGVPAPIGAGALPAPLVQRSEPPVSVEFVAFEQFLSSAPSRAPPSA